MKATYTVRAYGSGCLSTIGPGTEWKYETKDLPALRTALGDSLFVGLLRCFVWADRLQSAWHFLHLQSSLPERSHAFGRNLQSMVWYSAGILFEASTAIGDMQERGLDARFATVESWQALCAMANRWKTEKRLLRLRHTLGFHVDSGLMTKGLRLACAENDRFVVLAGDDRRRGTTSLRLGLEVLLKGTEMDIQDVGDVTEIVRDDSGDFADHVQKVLIHVLVEAGGLPR